MRSENRFSPESPSRALYERDEVAASVADSAFDPAIDDLSDEMESPVPDDDDQFLRAPRRVPVRKSPVTKKTAKRLRWAMLIAGILFAFGAIYFALNGYATRSWRFRIQSSDSIETAGLSKVTRAQLLNLMAADIGRNIFRVPLDERRKQIEDIPWVESATVMRLIPDRLRIVVTERQPLAFVRVGSKISLIDHTGVVMDLPVRLRSSYSFPVITGMTDADPLSTRAARMRIYSRLVGELDADNLNYSKDLSEVDLSDPEDVKITVEDPGGALVVHLGSSDFLERYRIYIRHINDWRQQFKKFYSVDLRFNGQIIVNPDTREETALSAGK